MKPATQEDLRTLVAAAAERRAGADDLLLTALAELDPAAAAAWLARRGAAPGRGAVPADVLRRIAAAVADDPHAIPIKDALRVVSELGHTLQGSAVADMAAALASAGAAESEVAAAVHHALERAPDDPALLRAAAELAIAAGDAERSHALLTRLGRADPTVTTVRFVHGARRKLAGSGRTSVRIALLSSFTIDPLAAFVDLECRALELDPEIRIAPFNSWGREMLGGGSDLERFNPEIAFLSVAVDDLVPALAHPVTSDDLRRDGLATVDHVLSVARAFTSWSPAILVVHSLHTAFPDPLGPAAGRDTPSRWEILHDLNARLAAGLRELPRAYLLEMTELVARRRRGTSDNPKMRHLARMRIGEHVLPELARAYAGYIAPLKGRTRKCVVLDLDNTLWGGIVGEDGPTGIRLGSTAPGSEYREFQQYLLGLSQRGVLLAINSKNNEADAMEVIRGHDAMVLREEAFSATRINWESKPNNMLSLAAELSIGLDSFVFVDDSEKERALMRQTLPQVLTVELPRDPALYRETLEALPELRVLAVTEEDRTRTRQYAERRQREQLRVSTQSIDEYLQSLRITASMGMVSEGTMTRVHQLFQRTNQFNLTTQRYEPGELRERAADASWRIYTSQVSDRFGDHGLVAAAVVRRTPDTWEIENFVMSCRVIGYGVEDALLTHIAVEAGRAGARALTGHFIPSKKNAPARDFYERNAFTRNAGAEPSEQWSRDLVNAPMAFPNWIEVRVPNDA